MAKPKRMKGPVKRGPRLSVLVEPESPASEELHVRLSNDLRAAAARLTTEQARYFVDTYYQIQDFRLGARNQDRAAQQAGEPSALLDWLGLTMRRLEGAIRVALDTYSDQHVAGRWAKSIWGIGPVIAAGLLAHIDVRRASTAGAVWRFAGLDPTVKWVKGEKRPWNARLKVLAWKIGDSFVKHQGSPHDVYGQVYARRKQREVERNTAGRFADQAAAALATRRYRPDTVARAAYEAGRLPDARIHLRAARYAVKLFLAHYHHVAYETEFHQPPPRPYVIEFGGHTDYIGPPNWPMDGQPRAEKVERTGTPERAGGKGKHRRG